MRKFLIGIIAVGALAFTACSKDSSPSYGYDEPVQTQPDIEVIADMAWDSLPSIDRVSVCLALSDGLDAYELDAFQEGSEGAFSETEAIDALNYIAENKC